MESVNFKNILLISFILQSIFFANALQLVDKDYTTNKNCRWVKVLNDESFAIDISDYKIVDSTAAVNGHGITAIAPSTDLSLDAGESATISNGDNNCGFTGKIFHSAISTAGTVSGVVPYYISIKAPSSSGTSNSTTTNATSTSENSSSTVSYGTENVTSNSSQAGYVVTDYIRRTYTLGDLALLSPKEVVGVAGGETEFFVKALDSKKNIITNVTWSFGDGIGGTGATTTHRYFYPGDYVGTIEVETNLAYGYERLNIKILKPDIQISDVVNSDLESYIEIKNNSEEEIDIGGFILSMDNGLFKLSKHLILLPHSKVKLSGKNLGFTNASNVKLLFEDKSLLTSFNSFNIINYSSPETKTVSSVVVATSSIVSNVKKVTPVKKAKVAVKPVVKTKKVVVTPKKPLTNNSISTTTVSKVDEDKSLNDVNKQATSSQEALIANIDTAISGDKTLDRAWHKWLYWLYE